MKQNAEIKNHLYDGQTIVISGIDSSYYPKKLINAIIESKVKDLTLIYIEDNTDLDPAGDPMQLIYNGQVSRLVTSHLGQLQKNFGEYLDSIELLPMDILAFKMQCGANRLPGLAIDYDYAKLYRDDEKWLEKHSFEANGKRYVMEPALRANVGIIVVDKLNPETFNSGFTGTAFTSVDAARMSDMCFAEALNVDEKLSFDDVDIPGQYIDGYVVSENTKYVKTNW